jgi:low affinity Fe/Cu permease
LISRRAKNVAAATGVIAGLIVIIWMILPRLVNVSPAWRNPLHGYLTIVVGTLTIFMVGLVVAQIGDALARRDHSGAGTDEK